MATITDVIVNFGEVFELDIPKWDIRRCTDNLINNPNWVQYNPRKSNNRKGLSVTSLDGGYSGIPDLDSIREYNKIHNTTYNETHFRVRTNITELIPELNEVLDLFPDHGRCHFLKLDAGGFFPPHRDNGTLNPIPNTFRLIVPIHNFGKYHLTWIQDGSLLPLEHGLIYFINTTKTHSLFSYVDNSICFVMNVIASARSITTLINHCMIR